MGSGRSTLHRQLMEFGLSGDVAPDESDTEHSVRKTG
jgi:hypothetical protein